MMSLAINTLVQLLITYSLMVIIVLMFRGIFNKIAGSRWVYTLWFTLLVPFVLMFLPNEILSSVIPFSIQQLSLADKVNSLVSFNSLNIFTSLLLAIWAGGAIVIFLKALQSNSRLANVIKTNCRQLSSDQTFMVDLLCKRAGVVSSPVTRCSPGVDGPALIGLVNPIILLPAQFFDKFNQHEQALMIFHELVHYKRRDAWSNLVFRILRCLFWFNPLMGLAERRFRLDQELACDQSVLCDEPLSQRAHYARAMLKASSTSYSRSLIGFRNGSPEILSRVGRLHQHRKF